MFESSTTAEEIITQCLDHFAYSDAIFLAECLFSQVPSASSVTLLANCYSRAGKCNAVFSLLHKHGPVTPMARFIMLKCCIQLNKFDEAERLIDCHCPLAELDFEYLFGTAAPFALQLYSVIYRTTGRIPMAVECIKKALSQYPFLWTAYQDVHQMIASVPEELTPEVLFANRWVNESIVGNENLMPYCTPVVDNNEISSNTPSILAPLAMTPTPDGPAMQLTPQETNPDQIRSSLINAPKKGVSRRISAPVANRTTRQSLASNARGALTQSNQAQVQTRSRVKGGLKENTNSCVEIARKTTSRNQKSRSATSNLTSSITRSTRRAGSVSVEDMNMKNEEEQHSTPLIQPPPQLSPNASISSGALPSDMTVIGLLGVVEKMAELCCLLWRYDCEAVVRAVCHVSNDYLKESPMLIAALANAYMELADYAKAASTYSILRAQHPHYMDGMELYSTALWHMQKEAQLSALAQDLTDSYKDQPQTWCAVGNSFSLAKEHDNAIKFFMRAVQVQPDFAYAYTLLGHEYIAIDATDKAEQAFRSAIRLQPRHYNAWFGLGLIYYKREQLKLAYHNFRTALSVNPSNSVLMCQLSMVLQALEKPKQALQLLDKALLTSPQNVLCRYHRAQLLFNGNKLTEALEELDALKLLVPRESSVFFLSGKVHRKLGNVADSLIDLCWSTELDPKGEQHNPLVGDRRYEDEPVTALAAHDATSPTNTPN